jgi:hypothetical protein
MPLPLAPSAILQIYQEPHKPGTRAAYHKIEVQLARAAREFGFTHAYFAIEALDGSEEVWWLNCWDSEEEPQQLAQAYEQNAPLKAAFEALGASKSAFLLDARDVVMRPRPALSGGPAWRPGLGRFLTVAVTTGESPLEGTVFEAEDGTRYTFLAARTRREAVARAAAAGPSARAFAVRPYWSKPDDASVAADPAFWRT